MPRSAQDSTTCSALPPPQLPLHVWTLLILSTREACATSPCRVSFRTPNISCVNVNSVVYVSGETQINPTFENGYGKPGRYQLANERPFNISTSFQRFYQGKYDALHQEEFSHLSPIRHLLYLYRTSHVLPRPKFSALFDF